MFSFLWIIFSGIWNSIFCFCLSVLYCVTLIGIPLGIIYFKEIKLVFTSLNKRVETHFLSHPFANVLWLLFGGLIISLLMFLFGLVFSITIIGIPFGTQYFKFAKFFFAPFGAKILKLYEIATDNEKKGVFTFLYLKINDINILESIIRNSNHKKNDLLSN